jgi:hypothetical protein
MTIYTVYFTPSKVLHRQRVSPQMLYGVLLFPRYALSDEHVIICFYCLYLASPVDFISVVEDLYS